MASVRNSRTFLFCIRQVPDTVKSLAVAFSPFSLRLPNDVLRHCTAVLTARSEMLFVGSTPGSAMKVNNRSACQKKAAAIGRTSASAHSRCRSPRAKNFFSNGIDFWMSCDRLMSPLRNWCHSRNIRACSASASRQNLSAIVVRANC